MNRPLTVMNLLSGDGRGGSDRLALDISKGLKRRRHRVIWGAPSACCLIEEAKAAGIEVFDPYSSGVRNMSVLPALSRFCKAENIDVVNAHDSHSRHLLAMARVRGLKTKIVFTRHCLLSAIPRIGAFYYNFVGDMNIAVSNRIRQSLLRSGIWQTGVSTAIGGVDIKKFEDVPQEKIDRLRRIHARPGALNIGIVARFSSDDKFNPNKPTMKGHEFLFRAAARLGRDFNLLVLGVWGERDIDHLKQVARCNGVDPERITVCGFQNDVAPFYKIMDVNVLPSVNEGLGLSILEAMASGVPCIGTDSGGISEIITSGVDGYLFARGNSMDLAAKLRAIAGDEKIRNSFILNAKEKVRKLFHISRTAREVEDIFYGLLA